MANNARIRIIGEDFGERDHETKAKAQALFRSKDGSSRGLRKAVEGVYEGLEEASTAVYEA